MRISLAMITLFLVMKLRYTQSRCEESGSRRSDVSFGNQRTILKRLSDLDYDSFVGLMGRRSSEANGVPSINKREMHDIFVGLMGRRNSEPDRPNGPWRRDPEQRGIGLNKCRLRFRRGL